MENLLIFCKSHTCSEHGKLQAINHPLKDCTVCSYTGDIKGALQASLGSAEWFEHFGINLKYLVAI